MNWRSENVSVGKIIFFFTDSPRATRTCAAAAVMLSGMYV